jgi:ribonuclease HII
MGKLIATFSEEKKLLAEGYDFVLGTDEVGRGPLAGPVVACVCALKVYAFPDEDVKSRFDLIRDSKTLSEKQREGLFDFICENFHVGIGICDHTAIDRLNILEASFLAMKRALTDFSGKLKQEIKTKKSILLVDGNKIIPSLSFEQKAIVSGDKLVKTISAASIIAKVTRDRMICEADKLYPEYGLAKHKGYGTKMHLEALKKHGPCEIHRLSFEPMKSWTKRAKGCYYKGVKYQLNP